VDVVHGDSGTSTRRLDSVNVCIDVLLHASCLCQPLISCSSNSSQILRFKIRDDERK
jgi:hypothetical protein